MGQLTISTTFTIKNGIWEAYLLHVMLRKKHKVKLNYVYFDASLTIHVASQEQTYMQMQMLFYALSVCKSVHDENLTKLSLNSDKEKKVQTNWALISSCNFSMADFSWPTTLLWKRDSHETVKNVSIFFRESNKVNMLQ